jgi:hypothetical protein
MIITPATQPQPALNSATTLRAEAEGAPHEKAPTRRPEEDAMTQVKVTRRRPATAPRELPELLTPSGRKLPW